MPYPDSYPDNLPGDQPHGTILAAVYDLATLTEIGRTVNVLNGKSSRKQNAAGSGSITIPLQLPSAERDLFQAGRLVAVFIWNGRFTFWQPLACFKIKKKQTKLTKATKQVTELSGPDLIQELAEPKIEDRVFSREYPIHFVSGNSIRAITNESLTDNKYKGWSIRTTDWSNRGVIKSNTNAVVNLENEFTDGAPAWPLFLIIYGVEPYHAQTLAKRVLDYAQYSWSLIPIGTNPSHNAFTISNGESVLENLLNITEQTGFSFRLTSLTAQRSIDWVNIPDTTFVTLYIPEYNTHYESVPNWGAITSLSETEDNNIVTRVIPHGSGLGDDRLTIKDTTQTLPAGFDWVLNENGHKKGVRNVILEATGIKVETEISWPHIKPANQSPESVPIAVETLVNTAVNYLQKRTTNEKFYSVTCILASELLPGQSVTMRATAQGQNPYIIEYMGPEVLYVQSVGYSVGKDGSRYTHLKLTETPQGRRDDSASLVASTIKEQRAVVRHTNTNPTTGGGASVTIGDHGTLDGLTHDDHPQYLLANGARVLTDDLLVLDGKTIDGVDISELSQTVAAHAADHDAHHTPGTLSVSSVNANNGIETHAIQSSSNPGQQASILATDAQGNVTIRQLTASGIILTDRATMQTYNLFVNNGRIYIEPV